MHSSRMHTAHILTIGGWVGGVPAQEGVPAQGGVPTRECTYPGGVPAQGVYLPGVVYLPRYYSPPL